MPHIIKAIQSPVSYNMTYDTDTIKQNTRMVLWHKVVGDVLRCMTRDEAARRLWKKFQVRNKTVVACVTV